jgi:hypothetical protein
MEWTAERRMELGEMWLAGLPRSQIAKHFQSAVGAVATTACHMGLPNLREIRRGTTGRMRSCMCCEQVFFSEGKHNRLCESCRGATH